MTTPATEGKNKARIRVDEHGVLLILDWAREEEQRLLVQRREMVDRGVSTEGHNQLLARVRRVRDEAQRAAGDLGIQLS